MSTQTADKKTTEQWERIKEGDHVAVITVTYAYVGVLVSKTIADAILFPAYCVYDTGDFGRFCAEGQIAVGEPLRHPAEINRAAQVAMTRWPFPIPTQPIPGDSQGEG